MAMHCTQKLPFEKILGLHYRGFEILALVFTQACELSSSKNWRFSRWVEKVRLGRKDKDISKGAMRPGESHTHQDGLASRTCRRHSSHLALFSGQVPQGDEHGCKKNLPCGAKLKHAAREKRHEMTRRFGSR